MATRTHGAKFDIPAQDIESVQKTVDRAFKEIPRKNLPDRLSLHMDITACHANGCPLDFDRLLKAPAFDFSHDVLGIVRYMDRETGKLTDCFLPRCAA